MIWHRDEIWRWHGGIWWQTMRWWWIEKLLDKKYLGFTSQWKGSEEYEWTLKIPHFSCIMLAKAQSLHQNLPSYWGNKAMLLLKWKCIFSALQGVNSDWKGDPDTGIMLVKFSVKCIFISRLSSKKKKKLK